MKVSIKWFESFEDSAVPKAVMAIQTFEDFLGFTHDSLILCPDGFLIVK